MSWVSKWFRSGGKAKLIDFAISIAFSLPPEQKRLKIVQALEAIAPILPAANVSARTQEIVRQAIEALKAEGVQ